MTVHATALISPEAHLGDDVHVGAFASIEADVRIGAGCVIRERAHICSGSTLGANCRIHMNAVIGHAPQDFSHKGGRISTVLGAGVTVRENATIHGSTNGTIVGDNCYLMVGSHVAHDCKLGKGVLMANGALLAGHVQVDDGAFVSGNVVIHQFVRIGRLAMLSGGSRFGMDVPPYLIGDGANAVTMLNTVGLRRSTELSDQDRREVKAAFKILYRSGLTLPRALERLEAEFESEAVRHWTQFFRSPSKRGFCRYSTVGRRGEQGE